MYHNNQQYKIEGYFMLKKAFILLISLSILIAFPAFAKGKPANICKMQDVAGSYTRSIFYTFTDGYANVLDRAVFRQLNLNDGGTAHQEQSDNWDGAHNFTGRTEWNGSWACRDDGKLVVTMMGAFLNPVPPDALYPGSYNDVLLSTNQRTTYLFTVDDQDTLTLVESRVRSYDMTQDPSDLAGGTLSAAFPSAALYSRLKASDADLLLP